MKYDNDFNEKSGNEDWIDEQAAVWFARLQAENVTAQEKAEFARWLAQDLAHRRAFDEIRMLWNDAILKQLLSEAEARLPAFCQTKRQARARGA
jgi:transmembrane sensor